MLVLLAHLPVPLDVLPVGLVDDVVLHPHPQFGPEELAPFPQGEAAEETDAQHPPAQLLHDDAAAGVDVILEPDADVEDEPYVETDVGGKHVAGDLYQQLVVARFADDGPVPEDAPPGERDPDLDPHPLA